MRRPANRFQGGDVAKNGLQVLVQDEARPGQPAEAEHHGEQPNDARDAGLVGEHDFEARKNRPGPARQAASRSALRRV